MKLIYISAVWCQPCKQLSPIMDQLQQEGIPIEKIDADNKGTKYLLERYGVRNVPTVLLVNDNGVMIHKLVGLHTKQEYLNLLK